MKRIAVLLSAYNGEEFIEEQINSILEQKYIDISIFIRDDGSTDKTPEILNRLSLIHKNITIFFEANIGVGNGFMRLIELVPYNYDYYCFSDQDDIWYTNKLISAVNKIEYEQIPTLYTSNQTVFSEIENNKYLRYKGNPSVNYCQILHQNLVSGCTMVWNPKLQNILRENIPSVDLLNNRIHDVWVAMVAACLGKIIYDPNSYILYRQHRNNVVGIKKEKYIKTIINKINNPKLLNGRSKLAREIIEKFENEIKDITILNTLKKYAYYTYSFNNKVQLINDPSLFGYTQESYPSLVFKVLFNLL